MDGLTEKGVNFDTDPSRYAPQFTERPSQEHIDREFNAIVQQNPDVFAQFQMDPNTHTLEAVQGRKAVNHELAERQSQQYFDREFNDIAAQNPDVFAQFQMDPNTHTLEEVQGKAVGPKLAEHTKSYYASDMHLDEQKERAAEGKLGGNATSHVARTNPDVASAIEKMKSALNGNGSHAQNVTNARNAAKNNTPQR